MIVTVGKGETMSVLNGIRESVQQVAEAISIAVGVEVEIVDNKLNIVGGTGVYQSKIGQKEEGGDLEGDFLYARVLRTGVTQYVADARNDENYGSFAAGKSTTGELAEICTPIVLNSEIIGIIGLVAFNEEQKKILSNKSGSMTVFVEKMADLLAAKADQQEILENVEVSRDEMSTVLETAHEGIFALDQRGYVKHCNNRAAALFGTTKMDLAGSHISKLMPGSPAIKVLETGRGYTENEEIFKVDGRQLHFIVTAKPFSSGEDVDGVVISFRDIEEAQKLVYNFNTRNIKNTVDDIIGTSENIMKAKKQALITARSNSTVLITGESGTGKEMFAKAIHYASARGDGPFITVNCGAIPENLMESELFGYEKGAFTGASEKGKEGKFELADGGTIFLDEIGDMPLHLQVKLLHVLQNMRFERVGGNKSILVDVRVIAATNRDLEKMIAEGSFREDLYYRLSVIPLFIPPLRERSEDIKTLMYHFLRKYNTFMNRKIEGFTPEVEELYMNHDWAGNVRELENAVEYGTNMAFGKFIGLDEVPARIIKKEEEIIKFKNLDKPLAEQVRLYEKEIITKKLKQAGGVKEVVARELGLSRATLYRKLAELDIN
ncbi:MAG: sigma 54-interacting transcriptional regulator [Bacillota bacterium]|nr:sigma 54-interacting transcriptional regulator [Bacillota bacterium]